MASANSQKLLSPLHPRFQLLVDWQVLFQAEAEVVEPESVVADPGEDDRHGDTRSVYHQHNQRNQRDLCIAM
jgi:hypothetical protein